MPLGPRDTFPFVQQSRRRVASERSLFFNLQVGPFGVCGRFVQIRSVSCGDRHPRSYCSLRHALSSPFPSED